MKKKGYCEENVLKPSYVVEYNHRMGTVNKQDQHLAYFSVMRKCFKGYIKILLYMCYMPIYNSYLLHNKINNSKKRDLGVSIRRTNIKNTAL